MTSPGAVHVAVVEDRGTIAAGRPVLRVESDIERNEVVVAVAIHVGDTKPRPPPGRLPETGRAGGVDEPRSIVTPELDRSPFGGDHQIEPAVAIHIGPGGRGHQTRRTESRRKLLGDVREVDPIARRVVAKQLTPRRHRVSARHRSSTDEEVLITVAVDVPGDDRSAALRHPPERIVVRRNQSGRTVVVVALVQIQAIPKSTVALSVLGAATEDHEVPIAIPVDVHPAGVGILERAIAGERRHHGPAETAVRTGDPELARLILRATEVDVRQIVPVDVRPGHARAERGELPGQEGLKAEVVVLVLAMHEAGARSRRRSFEDGRLRGRRRIERLRLADHEPLIRGDRSEPLQTTARPEHFDRLDLGVVAKAEVQFAVVGRCPSGPGIHRSHQIAVGRRLHGDDAPDPVAIGGVARQPDSEPVSIGVVPIDRHRLIEIRGDQIEIPVEIEVAVCGAVGHAELAEPPRLAAVVEDESTTIPVGHVVLAQRLLVPIVIPLGAPEPLDSRERNVRIGVVPTHAVREVHVRPAVLIEVRDLHRPGPVGAVQAGQKPRLPIGTETSVEVEHVPHRLSWPAVLENPTTAPTHLTHVQLGLEVGRGGHVRDHEVEHPIAIEIADVGSHARPGRVGQDIGDGVLESDGSVGGGTEVSVEAIGILEVVGDMEIQASIPIDIDPGGRQGMARTVDPNLRRHVLVSESTITVRTPVDQEVVVPPVAVRVELPFRGLPRLEVPLVLRKHLDGVGLGVVLTGRLVRKTIRRYVSITADVDVEVPVVVDVGEGGEDRSIANVQPVGGRLLREARRSGRRPVDEQLIRGVVVADVDVEVAVPVDVDERGAGPPRVTPTDHRIEDPGEPHPVLRVDLEVEPVLARPTDAEDVRTLVAVEITDAHATAGVPEGEEVVLRMVGKNRIDEVDAGSLGRKGLEHRGSLHRLGRPRERDRGEPHHRDDQSTDGRHGRPERLRGTFLVLHTGLRECMSGRKTRHGRVNARTG